MATKKKRARSRSPVRRPRKPAPTVRKVKRARAIKVKPVKRPRKPAPTVRKVKRARAIKVKPVKRPPSRRPVPTKRPPPRRPVKRQRSPSTATWFRDLSRDQSRASKVGDSIAAGLAYRKRLGELEYLKESVRLARKYVKGFTARDGYDLTHPERITGAKLKRLRKVAPRLRQVTASPNVTYRPRSAKAKRALIRHTGIDDIRGMKAFPVHVQKPERTRVRLKGRKHKSLEISETIHGRVHHDRYFYLSDFLKGETVTTDKRGRKRIRKYSDSPPVTFAEIIKIAERMIPHMPRGYYVIETSTHGTIGIHMPRNDLIYTLRRVYLDYDMLRPMGQDNRGLAETVIGFRLVSSNIETARREYNERLTNRIRLARARQAERARRRRLVTSRLKRGR